jgi:hypothetical protein
MNTQTEVPKQSTTSPSRSRRWIPVGWPAGIGRDAPRRGHGARRTSGKQDDVDDRGIKGVPVAADVASR